MLKDLLSNVWIQSAAITARPSPALTGLCARNFQVFNVYNTSIEARARKAPLLPIAGADKKVSKLGEKCNPRADRLSSYIISTPIDFGRSLIYHAKAHR